MVITFQSAVDFLGAIGESVPRVGVKILALQGAQLRRQVPGDHVEIRLSNQADKYDDLFIVIGHRRTGGKSSRVFEAFRGTTQPGAYYTQVDPHPQGAANLTYGTHYFVLGDHNGHPALRGKNELNRIWRDKDGDFVFDLSEQVYIGRFGTNIHAGGRADTIGKWSAGCFNVWGGYDGPAWKRFYELSSEECSAAGEIAATLWRATDLDAFLRSGSSKDWRPTIYPGTLNDWVVNLTRGMGLRETRDYSGPVLLQAAAWQKAQGLVPDGICGPRTWTAIRKAG